MLIYGNIASIIRGFYFLPHSAVEVAHVRFVV